MDEQQTPKRRGRNALAAVLAAGAIGALAVPATSALAGSGDTAASGSGSAATAPQPGFVQDEGERQPPEGGERDRDCPEKDGRGNGGSGGSLGQGGGANPEAEL
jgi:hypothetical protein